MHYGSTNDIQQKKNTLNVAVFDNNLQNRFVTISPEIKNLFSVPTGVTIFLISENVECVIFTTLMLRRKVVYS